MNKSSILSLHLLVLITTSSASDEEITTEWTSSPCGQYTCHEHEKCVDLFGLQGQKYECVCVDGYHMSDGVCMRNVDATTEWTPTTVSAVIEVVTDTTSDDGDVTTDKRSEIASPDKSADKDLMKYVVFAGSGGVVIIAIVGMFFLYKYCSKA